MVPFSRLPLRFSLVACLIAAPVLAAGIPASNPTTQAGLSSPKDAFRTYTTALQNGDRNGVSAAVILSDKVQKLIDGQIAYSAIEAKFRAAAVKAFPDADKDLPDNFPASLAAIDSADVKIDGDTATLTTKQTMQPVKLRRQDGVWKVDLAAMYGDAVIDEVINFRKAFAEVMEQVTDDVGHGKFTDYNDVRSNLEQRLKMRLAMPPADEATTKP